jgi:hypothetical protein
MQAYKAFRRGGWFGCAVAGGVVLAVCMPAEAQVSARILVDGQNALTVPSQQVRLDVVLRIESTLSLSALQFTLDSSHADLWEFVDPPLVVGAPWQQEDLFLVRPQVSEGAPLSVRPDILLFKQAMPDYPASSYPSDILTFSLRSAGVLSVGSYTFSIGGVALPPIWVHTQDDLESISGEIVSAGIFTLTVTEGLPGDDDPGDDPGDDPVDDPGDDPGDDPADDPGDDPGDDPADDPGDDPADDPTDPTIPVDPIDDPTGPGDDPADGGDDAPDPDDGTIAPPGPRMGCGFGAPGVLAVGMFLWATFAGVRRRSWQS